MLMSGASDVPPTCRGAVRLRPLKDDNDLTITTQRLTLLLPCGHPPRLFFLRLPRLKSMNQSAPNAAADTDRRLDRGCDTMPPRY